jgi:uncharacterized OsmC-like protein
MNQGGWRMELIQERDRLELVHEQGNWCLKEGAGFSPVQLVAAATAACSTYVFENLLNMREVTYAMKKVVLDYQLGSYYPNPLARIDVQFVMQAEGRDREEVEHVFYQIAENCPVLQSLHPRIKVNESIRFI